MQNSLSQTCQSTLEPTKVSSQCINKYFIFQSLPTMFVNSHHQNIEGAQAHTMGREVVVRQPCMALHWHYSKARQAAGQREEQQPPSCQEPEQHQNHILSESKGKKIGSNMVQNQRRRQSASEIKIKSPPHESKGKK
jgi:hypothetical protein